MTLSDHDLEKYFRYIGFSGSRGATLDTLAQLQRLHTQAIAFENLDPLMRKHVSLDPQALSRKFIDECRGGYCYEHNSFLQQVLRQLGFSVSSLAAMVLWGRPQGGPRNHMALRVDLSEGTFLVDAGFGRLTQTSPLLLAPDIEQKTTLENFRLLPAGPHYRVQAKLEGQWASLYEVSLQEISGHDIDVYNWFSATHPDVIFTSHLMAARPAEDRRFALFDNAFSIHHVNGPSERRVLTSAQEMAAVLEKYFCIRIPAGCEDVLERLTP